MTEIQLAPDIKSFEDVKSEFKHNIEVAISNTSRKYDSRMVDALQDFHDLVEDWEDIHDVYTYYTKYEDSSDDTFVRWLRGHRIIDYDLDWYEHKFKRGVMMGSEMVRFNRALIRELNRQIIQRRYNFDDDDMGILEI